MNLVWKGCVLFSCQSLTASLDHTLQSPKKLSEGMALFSNADSTSVIILLNDSNKILYFGIIILLTQAVRCSLKDIFSCPVEYFFVHLAVLAFLCSSSGFINIKVCVLDFFS